MPETRLTRQPDMTSIPNWPGASRRNWVKTSISATSASNAPAAARSASSSTGSPIRSCGPFSWARKTSPWNPRRPGCAPPARPAPRAVRRDLDIAAIMDFLTREALERGIEPPVPEVNIFNEAFMREVRLWGRAYEPGLMAEMKLRSPEHLFGRHGSVHENVAQEESWSSCPALPGHQRR